jgi:hypothetical protein
MDPCPCGLTYEYLVSKGRVDNEDNCTAKWADQAVDENGHRLICGKPPGAHPSSHAPPGIYCSSFSFLFIFFL